MTRRILTLLAAAALALAAVAAAQARSANLTDPDDVVTVTADALDAYWTDELDALGRTYRPPADILWYYANYRSPCGVTPAMNAAYCSLDRKIYLGRPLFDALVVDDGEDFAGAAVLAHEWGHEIQDQLGLLSFARKKRLWIGKEVQADCFAGLFANYADEQGMLEDGDVTEAAALMVSIGDDPHVKPSDPGAHGSSEKRLFWFMQGYLRGDFRVCLNALVAP